MTSSTTENGCTISDKKLVSPSQRGGSPSSWAKGEGVRVQGMPTNELVNVQPTHPVATVLPKDAWRPLAPPGLSRPAAPGDYW